MSKTTCEWCLGSKLYEKYHDQEWGVPIKNDQLLFEYLMLESAQAGLSWHTILKKRENYRKALNNFNPKYLASLTNQDVDKLMSNAGIIRYEPKIRAMISNAKAYLKIQEEIGSFGKFQWSFVNNKPIINHFSSLSELPSQTNESKEFHKALKKRGFKFLGPVTVYAHMQACGMVNDHLTTCQRHAACAKLMKEFKSF